MIVAYGTSTDNFRKVFHWQLFHRYNKKPIKKINNVKYQVEGLFLGKYIIIKLTLTNYHRKKSKHDENSMQSKKYFYVRTRIREKFDLP